MQLLSVGRKLMRLRDLIEGVDSLRLTGDLEKEVDSLHYDSRQVKPGSLFVAIRGFRQDGHDFIPQALQAGASVLVVQSESAFSPPPSGITLIQVESSRLALAQIAANFYHHPSRKLRLIGVTGTNGKTTITFLIESLLSRAGHQVGVIGTINYRFAGQKIKSERTTPESLDLQRVLREMENAGVGTVVMEVSSHSLELGRVEGCEFDLAIFTNLTQDHLDFHGDLNRYLNAKLRLFSDLGKQSKKATHKLALINMDDPFAQKVFQATPVEAWSYGLNQGARIRPYNLELSSRGMRFCIQTPQNSISIQSRLIGEHNVYNILAATGAGIWADLSPSEIEEGIGNVQNVPGRWERIEVGQRFTVVVDYAHTGDALERVLKAAKRLCEGRLITVFGCGGDRDRAKRPIMGEIAARYSDYFIITSDNPRSEDAEAIISEIEQGVKKACLGRGKYDRMVDRREAIAKAIEAAQENDLIVIAGKGHETYQILREGPIAFDDREVATTCIRKRLKDG
jgi:UDP-N-acetylmuramoyl-L-alanyl-D-glutamate--2,6-diaminopimelate ligase